MVLTLHLPVLRLAVGCQVWTVWQLGSSAFLTRCLTVCAITMPATRIFPTTTTQNQIHNYKKHRSKRSC